jgi:hypothetical protein
MATKERAHTTTAAAVSDPGARRVAYVLSTLVAAIMPVASIIGLLVPDIYHEDPWALAALHGGDLVTLVVASTILVGALLWSARGSERALLLWTAALAYNVYNFAYYAFGAAFNNLFLAHIALFALSTWALVFLLASVDVRRVSDRLRTSTKVRVAAALVLSLIAAGLTALWTTIIVRQAVTGELPQDAATPTEMHLVYAIDLGLFVPMLVVAAWLLWRDHPWGVISGTAMALGSATYLLNLMAAQAFQTAAHVPGIASFSPMTAALACACTAVGIALLRSGDPQSPDS